MFTGSRLTLIKRVWAALGIVLTTTFLASGNFLQATTISSPNFDLDAANPSSLAVSTPTVWKDLVSNSTQLTIASNTSRSTEGGGSLQVSSGNGAQGAQSGSSGAYLAPSAVGSAYNPSGDMSIFLWIKPTSWNTDWNIFASRWFIDLAGTGGASDYHFSIKSTTSGGAVHKLNLYTTSASEMWGNYDFALNKWYSVGFTLTAGGNMQMYVNGQPDGAVRTSAGHTATNTSYLFVGDARSGNNCWTCSMNGYIGKFRIWNSVLTSSQVAGDYRNEAATFGYSSSLALSLASNTPQYRISNTITATITGPTNYAGKITFYENGKTIVGCKNKATSTSTATCAWKPSRHGVTTISASYTPSDLTFLTGSVANTYIVKARANNR